MELSWGKLLSVGFLVIFVACSELDAASTQRLHAIPEKVERKCGYEVSMLRFIKKISRRGPAKREQVNSNN